MSSKKVLDYYHEKLKLADLKSQERANLILQTLSSDRINLHLLRSLAFQGCTDVSGLRSIVWKVLLNYLPIETEDWETFIASKRAEYGMFKEELIKVPKLHSVIVSKEEEEERRAEKKEVVPVTDHPLSTATTSTWNIYFEDMATIEEIDKDVQRTRPEMNFFHRPVDPTVNQETPPEDADLHSDVLERILFIYAKLNPGIKYVQGMNEILAPIYYLFAADKNPVFEGNAEPDTFFCFTNVMSEIRDHFCRTLDSSKTGIKEKLKEINTVLKRLDYSVWRHLEDLEIDPQYYALRWVMLLFAQEFEIPDVLRLWDSLFSDPFRFNYLNYISCALILNVKDKVMEGDFTDVMSLLQRLPPTQIHTLLTMANTLLADDERGIQRMKEQQAYLERENPEEEKNSEERDEDAAPQDTKKGSKRQKILKLFGF